MATNVEVPNPPYQAPLIDEFGFLSRPWVGWFNKALKRMGGNIAYPNNELLAAPVQTADLADAAITEAKLAASVAGSGLAGGAGTALSVNVDGSTIEVNVDTLRVKADGITANEIAANSVNTSELVNGAVSFAKLLSSDWPVSAAASGWCRIGSGVMIQWGTTGTIASATNTAVNFPGTFPTACYQVIACVRDNSGGLTGTAGQWGTGSYSTTGFTLFNRTAAAYDFNYIAVGK